LSSGKIDCFFLDACILLPQKNRRYAESCARFLKENSGRCRVSSSVKGTILSLLKDAYQWIVKDIQNGFFPYTERRNIKKVTGRDGLIFEQFFDERRRQLRSQGSPYIYYEIVGRIEHWTALKVHEMRMGLSVKPEDFLASLTTEVSIIYEALRSPIEAIEGDQIAPSADLRTEVLAQGVTKMEDIIHLASAIHYQFINNAWVVFVTFDEDHILSRKRPLSEVCALHCSKPAYAHDHHVKLSRMKKPVQYYIDIQDYTSQQVSFAKAIEKSLQIKIIS